MATSIVGRWKTPRSLGSMPELALPAAALERVTNIWTSKYSRAGNLVEMARRASFKAMRAGPHGVGMSWPQ